MFNLMKYELFRRKKVLITALIALVLMEIGILFGIYKGENWLAMTIPLIAIAIFAGLAFPFLDSIIHYYSDFKNKHGYMLFMTPNNGYKIIGSKALFGLLELISSILLVAGLMSIAYTFARNQYSDAFANLEEQASMIMGLALGIEKITFPYILFLFFAIIFQYFASIMQAIMAITISKTLLSNKSFNWLVALLMYFALYAATQFLILAVMALLASVGDKIDFEKIGNMEVLNIFKYLLSGMFMYMLLSGVYYFFSGRLATKRIDI